MSEPQQVRQWNTLRYKKQSEINKEIDQLFGAKKINEYEENGRIVSVYEYR